MVVYAAQAYPQSQRRAAQRPCSQLSANEIVINLFFWAAMTGRIESV